MPRAGQDAAVPMTVESVRPWWCAANAVHVFSIPCSVFHRMLDCCANQRYQLVCVFFPSSHGQVTWGKSSIDLHLNPSKHSSFFLSPLLLLLCLISLSPSLHLLCWEVDLFSLVLFLSLLCTVVDRCPFVHILFAWYLVILCCFDRTYDVTIHDHCLLLLQSWLLIKNLSPLP